MWKNGGMVGDPGIEPGVGLPGGVTVRCRTLQPVARTGAAGIRCEGVITLRAGTRQAENPLHPAHLRRIVPRASNRGLWAMKKPKWVIEKEQGRRAAAAETVWLFGIHAVRDALVNPSREKLRLMVTKNAADKLQDAIAQSGLEPEVVDPRKFSAPIDPASVHQGAALEVKALNWGPIEECCLGEPGQVPLVVLLDRVTDPHNVGAILRSAEVFGARAVIAPHRNSAPETGALAKTASGALERQPYLRVKNLADAMVRLQDMGYVLLGLDGEAESTLGEALEGLEGRPVGLVLGAEGPGLRQKTRETCDQLVKIPYVGDFGSLNVSNAAAVGLYAARTSR